MPVHTPSPPTSSRPLYPAPYLRPPSQSSPTRRRRPSITTTQPRKKRKNIPSDVDIAEIRRKSDTRWKEQDLEYLSQALAAGHSYESIARHLVRSIASVHVRATRLRKAQKAMMAKQEPETEQPVHGRTRKIGRPSTMTTHHEEPDTSDSASSSSSTSTSTSASPVALIESITQQLQHPQATRPLWAATNAPYFHEAHRILPTSGDEDYIHHLKQKRLLEQQRGLYNTATFMNAWQHTFPQPYDAAQAAAAQIQTLAAQTSYLQQQHHQQQQQYQAMSSSSSTSASPSLSPPPPPETSTSDIGLNVPSHVTMITINNSNSILTNGSSPFVASSLPAYDYSHVTHDNNNNYDHHQHITSTTLNPATCTTPALPQFPFHYAHQQAHAHAQAQAQAFAAQHQSLLAQYQQAVSNGSLPANEHISIGTPLFQTPDFNFLQHTHTMPT